MKPLLLVLVAGLCLAPAAEAQFPFFKKKKKEPPPVEAAAKGPAEVAAPGATPPPATTGAAAAVAPAQPPGAAPAVAAPAPAAPAPGQGRAMTPEQEAALQTEIDQAIGADVVNDTSMAKIGERMGLWQKLLLNLPLQDERRQAAQQAFDRAKADFDAAKTKQVAAGTAGEDIKKAIADKLQTASAAIGSKDWGNAERDANWVLQRDPQNSRAERILQQAASGRKLSDLLWMLGMLGAVLVIVAIPLVLVGKWYAKKREDRIAKEQTAAANRAAVLQIVDGLARGKLITLDRDKATFKIGAATGPGDTEKNDLVISDSATLISRYHCSLIRRAGDYFLVDTSLNGTAVNGELLKRGDHYPLEDGDEITVADVSRIKFLHA